MVLHELKIIVFAV